MVVASQNSMKIEKIELPIIDLNSNPSEAAKQIVKACEKYGFFKVINHGVPQEIISGLEEEARGFFSKPGSEKHRAGPANPFGYGCKNIGPNGDFGEVEYLLLQTNPSSISNQAKSISDDSNKFSSAVTAYVEAVREVACEILDLMVIGLGGPDPDPALSGLIRDPNNDSVLRLNHYPPAEVTDASACRVGFGEHTDPQILTLLRSNGVEGLQISLEDGVWIPVNPYPESAFCVNVGDVLQAMTNGRFVSVKHRVVVKSYKSRMSTAYFAAPPLEATISRLPWVKTPPIYRSFSWGEYKKATYSCRLGDARINLFTLLPHQH